MFQDLVQREAVCNEEFEEKSDEFTEQEEIGEEPESSEELEEKSIESMEVYCSTFVSSSSFKDG